MLLVVGRLAARCGDVVAIASTISGRCVRTSLSLSADRIGRSSERLAMVCTVKTSDGAEGEARNGREVGGEVFRCGGDSIAQKRTRCPPVPSVMVRRGEV